MEGFSCSTDGARNKKVPVVDLEKSNEYLEDLLDVIAYEESKNEFVYDFEEAAEKILA